jgi:hypothetical protein
MEDPMLPSISPQIALKAAEFAMNEEIVFGWTLYPIIQQI